MIHDTNEPPKTVVPMMGADSLKPETRRINQNIELVSIKQNIVQVTASGIPNGQTSILELNFDNIQNAGTIGAFWEVVVFVDSTDTSNVLYPYHFSSTIDLSQWQVLGLAGSLLQDSGADYTPTTTYSEKLALRNISAGTVDLIFQIRSRYIFNRG